MNEKLFRIIQQEMEKPFEKPLTNLKFSSQKYVISNSRSCIHKIHHELEIELCLSIFFTPSKHIYCHCDIDSVSRTLNPYSQGEHSTLKIASMEYFNIIGYAIHGTKLPTIIGIIDSFFS